MITGEFRNTMDEKGRLMIPPKMRDQLGKDLMLTKSLDNTLWLYPKEEFNRFSEALNNGPLAVLDPNVSKMNRFIIAPAHEVELDKTGRLSIPQVLRREALLDGRTECVILGSGTHVEIISADRYETLQQEFLANPGAVAEALIGQKGKS